MNQGRIKHGTPNIHDPIAISTDDIEKRDILQRHRLAERILKRLGEPDCPRVVGIYGSWGTGKTSLVNMLIHANGGENGQNFCILNIDAWKYESGDGLLIPVIIHFKELTGSAELPDIWKSIAKRAVATAGIAIGDGLLSPFGVGPSQIGDVYDKLSSRDDQASYIAILEKWERQADEIEETEKAFEKLVSTAIQFQGGKRILICVDNLDRCSPENAVRLLESVKNFFQVPGCIWLFAIDSDVVAGYINKKYQDTGVDGYSYLDKIIPEQFHLSLSPVTDRQLIETLLQYAIGEGRFQFDVENKVPQIPKVLVPRRLIKSARKFAEFYKSRHASRGIPPETVMMLCLLYHTWPNFYQRLSSGSDNHIQRILENFFPEEVNPSNASKSIIPLHESLVKDSELTYFVRMAFPGIYSDSPVKYVKDIILGLSGLRECGLP